LSDADERHARQREIADLQQDFPGYRVWQEAMGDRIQLVAVRRKAATSPHTLVTTDVAELRATLAKSPPTRQAGEQVAGYDGAVTERAEGSRHAGASGSSGRTGTSP